MYELIPLTPHDYYIDCPAKIGLVRVEEDQVILIDSGSDKDTGKKVYRILQEKGWTLQAIWNTHSHADHIGGNHFLQEKTGCRIYARGLECTFTNTPVLEPMGLYGGLPLKDLLHKFTLAQESVALPMESAALPGGLTLLELPGHCFDMVGFLTPDGTAYIADSVSSPDTLEKYGIGYLWDPQAALGTLDALETLDARHFVPSHAPVTQDIAPLVQCNRRAILDVIEKILLLCRQPLTPDDLLGQLFRAYGMTMTVPQYALIGSTLRSYLSSLYAQGKISVLCDNGQLRWQTVLP